MENKIVRQTTLTMYEVEGKEGIYVKLEYDPVPKPEDEIPDLFRRMQAIMAIGVVPVLGLDDEETQVTDMEKSETETGNVLTFPAPKSVN